MINWGNRITHFVVCLVFFGQTTVSSWAGDLTPTQTSGSFEDLIEEQELKVMAEVEIIYNHVLSLPQSTPLDQLNTQLEKSLDRLKSMVVPYRNLGVSRFATQAYFRAIQQLGQPFDKIHNTFFIQSFKKYYPQECLDFLECAQLISDTSALVDLFPEKVSDYAENLLIYQRQLTYLMTINSPVPYSDSFAQRMLEFKWQSLKVTSDFYASLAKYPQGKEVLNGGLPPLINDNDIQSLKGEFELLEEEFFKMLEFSPSSYLNQSTNEQMAMQALENLVPLLHQDLLEFQFGIKDTTMDNQSQAKLLVQMLAQEWLQSLLATHLGNQGLALYLKRIGQVNLTVFLNDLNTASKNVPFGQQLVLSTLLRFAERETSLPYRREWVNLYQKIAQQTKSDEKNENLIAMGNSLQELLQVKETMLEKWAQSNQLTQPMTPGGKSAWDILQSQEKKLAQSQENFFSLWHQLKRQELVTNNLALAVAKYQENKTEQAQKSINHYLDVATIEWLTLSCNAFYGISSGQNSASLSLPWAENQNIPLAKACLHRQTKLAPRVLNGLTNAAAFDYVLNKRFWTTMSPVLIEAAVSFVSIPIVIASAGAAAPASAVGARLATSAATGLITRYAIGRIGQMALLRIAPRLASAIFGSVVFTLTQRTLMTALTLGHVKFYERDKSLWDNYGKDLLVGSAIFFFLPFLAIGSHSITTKIGQRPYFQARPLQRELMGISVGAIADTVFFTSIPVVEAKLKQIFSNSQDPAFKSYNDFYQALGHSWALTLAFRINPHSRIKWTEDRN